MNSRERVLAAALRSRADDTSSPVRGLGATHRCPDRPPTALRCTPEVWEKLRAHFGVDTDIEVMDALDVNLRWISLPFIGPPERSAVPLGSEGTDFWGCHIRKVETGFNTYYEFYDFPLAGCQTVADVEAYDWPELDWWDHSAVPRLIEEQNAQGPRAIGVFAGGAFESPWCMRGLEQFLVDLSIQPEIAEAISRRVEAYYRQRALLVLEVARGQIDVIGSGGDVGTQRGMMLKPDHWRRHIKPYTGRLISTFKEMGLVTFYHSCGSIVPIIADLIEVGLDILDPVQVSAAGMDPESLFRAFGDKLSFHGGIAEHDLLPHGTPQHIYQETTRMVDILGRNGGIS